MTHNQNPLLLPCCLLPALDGIYPIGILNKNNRMLNLHTIIALADKIGVTGIQLDMESMQAARKISAVPRLSLPLPCQNALLPAASLP